MLCSRCSDPIRPIVAIDIDGTMGDYHLHFVKFALGYMGQDDHLAESVVSGYIGSQSMGEWFCQVFDTDIRTFRDIKLAYRQGGQKRNMPVEPWASPLTNMLKERAEIWLTTTRPYLRLDGVDPDTRFWLHHNNIYYDHLLYHEAKYGVLSQRVNRGRVVAVVDDLHFELENAEHEFGRNVCIMHRARHNRAHWYLWTDQIAHDGQTVKMLIDRRLDVWYERNGTHGIFEGARIETEPA